MAEYAPMDVNDQLSPNELEFILNWPYEHLSRLEILINALMSTRRPTNVSETIFNGYLRHEKFHDKEPSLIVTVIESLCPDYFNDLPRRNKSMAPTLTQKKRMVGRATKQFLKFGSRQYGKPRLRVLD